MTVLRCSKRSGVATQIPDMNGHNVLASERLHRIAYVSRGLLDFGSPVSGIKLF
jgi:hypothetical protein